MGLFDKAFGIHEQVLPIRNRRLSTIAMNIANAETPNFKARDLNFDKALRSVTGDGNISKTHESHLPMKTRGEQQFSLEYEVPLQSSADGNTVEINVQQAKFGNAAGRYQSTLSFIESRISGIRKALRGD